MIDHETIGADWLGEEVGDVTEEVAHLSPVDFNEQNRYLPSSVTPLPGYIRYDVNPFMREILNCFDTRNEVREVNLMKGVQITFTTLLESGILYYLVHVKGLPIMLLTADKELATARIENNVIPMLNQSGFADIIRSSDETSTRKTGKALQVDTLIPTPVGDRRMGDLSVGDYVFSLDGTPTKVLTESPIHERECYEVSFANGERIIASDDHRWTVCPSGNSLKDRTLTTRELFDQGPKRGKEYRYRVRVSRPVLNQIKKLEVAPYTLGAWLGDGTSSGDDAETILSGITSEGYLVKKLLDRLGVVNNKHIPNEYFYASEGQRMALLRGLMDTDGTALKHGECEITQKNHRLAYDIWRLVNSLGMKATIKKRMARSQNGTQGEVSRVKFWATRARTPFTVPRKTARLKEFLTSRAAKNSIVSVSPVGRRTVKCIGVEHPSELFLCGAGYIPTHNTANHLQVEGGGYLVPFGARNPAKMRQYSIAIMLKDELDGWPDIVGKDGCPDVLSDGRTKGYSESRKIFRGSTPLILGTSKIHTRFLEGDQRYYNVRCKRESCRHLQVLNWHPKDGKGGFLWDLEDGTLDIKSVRYCCAECGQPHYEYDKKKLFSTEDGAHWVPTAKPKMPGIRSYHLPALYSPVGLQPWYICVSDFLAAFDMETKKVIDIGKYQAFYNNILGKPFEKMGAKVSFSAVSAHRRTAYSLGMVPNKYAQEVAGSKILFLTCEVDVHDSNLAVTVFGWAKNAKSFLIDYRRLEPGKGEPICKEISSPVWGRVRSLIEEEEYIADDGTKYKIKQTFVDSGYATDTVVAFCSDYISGVYPIVGRDRPAKYQQISEFAEFKTKAGTTGFRILVDHYKDRIATVLRRDWVQDSGEQKPYHFNAPIDTTDKQLKELTVESLRKKRDPVTGVVTFFWYRPSGAENELWDLLVYAHASVEVLAWNICIQHFELETVDWAAFWQFAEERPEFFERVDKHAMV